MTAWLDGRFVAVATLPKPDAVAPFETMAARAGELPLWPRHLDRLAVTAARLGLPTGPTLAWRGAAVDLLLRNGHGDGVLRLLLAPVAGRVHVVMTTRPRSPLSALTCLPTVLERPTSAPPADLKAEPRGFYSAVLQQAQDGGADEGLVVAPDGAVLEFANGNLCLRRDGRWCTPPLDGRVLPGLGRALLLEAAAAAGMVFRELPCGLGDLHGAEALAHVNAVYGPRPISLLGAAPAVAIVDNELGRLWRRATNG
ncbi:MAG: aminotransferase class IV [Planctomycetes bacterium]|nr:aminotransferase class IV [Planctomycetota bacterium]